jgi:hypothetical protein
VGLLTIAVLAMTGSVLSRVDEIEGERGGTLTVVSLEGSPDLDPARINDVYGTMINAGAMLNLPSGCPKARVGTGTRPGGRRERLSRPLRRSVPSGRGDRSALAILE